MTKIIIVIAFLMPTLCFGQKKNESIVTSIGWTIQKGDKITLGVGSMPDGRYKFIQTSEAGTLSGDGHLPNRFSGKTYEVYKIKVFRGRQIPVIKLNNLIGIGSRFDIEIEGAIANNEIVVPEKYRKEAKVSTGSKADELAKLKKLLDDGVLTKEEFESEKKKVLDK